MFGLSLFARATLLILTFRCFDGGKDKGEKK